MKYRKETDSLGSKKIPSEAFWGIHTQRAFENFHVSSLRMPFNFLRALAMVKKAACQANRDLGYLDKEKAGAINVSCDEIIDGKLSDQFPLDALQGGAGTSTNMNINEVIANRAIEKLGGEKGDYQLIHPIEAVNMHQSTNDVYPTAVKIAAICGVRDLSEKIALLQGVLQEKEKEFAGVVKIGRTELQQAVPITLGAEFSAFAEGIARDRWRTFKCEERLRTVNIGGTAVGTGISAPKKYIFLVIEKLREITGLGLCRAENPMGETANVDSFVEVSGILKAHASNLIKMSNDLRLLTAFGELRLPQTQAGSSIIPGKVNPVILEAAIQAGIKVIANDGIITEAASRGSLQINEFMPLLATAILESVEILVNINTMLSRHIFEINADVNKCQWYVDHAPSVITAFIPHVGYDRAGAILEKFKVSGGTDLRSFLEKQLSKELVDKVFSPFNLLR